MQIVELKVNVEKSQLNALAAEVNKLNGKVINFKTSTGGTGGASPTAGFNRGLQQTQQQAERTGQSIVSVMGKVAKWTAVTTAVYAPIKAFKEAVTTIKALDTEMVNVQKVTGASAKQMQQFQDRAYQLSKQYGRSVTDVAAAMTSFARAGYGDRLDEMAELSTLVQNVGYVSEDTADRMLLAVDAAWKLNGSHSELMKVIDGVDKVTNQNATDFQKMAEGMTVAASVFAESGESIQTFAAMVGTGTAATQRGGSEIARGLRTIMMNIRQIKGETEDGELIDGESIAKASAALKEFAGISTMENGELRKASDVLSDLAKKWKDLDSVQQSAISEALAGKRQANVLTALMGNWDMYEKQMQEYATAAGTAFKENEIYMNSWAAKTEQLKATWTDFVANFVTSDLATGVLDGLTGFIEILDSGFGQAAISAAAFALALKRIASIGHAIAGSKLVGLITSFAKVTSGQGIVAALSKTLSFLGPIGIALAGIAAIIGGVKLYDFFHVDYGESLTQVQSLKDEYEALYGTAGEYQALLEKMNSEGGLTAYEQSRLDFLKQERQAMEDNIETAKELALQRYQETYGEDSGYKFVNPAHEADVGNGGIAKDVELLRNARSAFDELTDSIKSGKKSREEAKSELKGILETYQDFYEEISHGLDIGAFELDDLTPATQDMMKLYDTMKAIMDMPIEEWDVGIAIQQFDKFAEVGDKSVLNWQALKKSLEEAGATADDVQGTLAQLKADDTVVLIDVKAENVDETLASLKEIGIATEEAGKTKVNVDAFADLANQLGMSREEATLLATSMESAGASLVDAEGNAADLGIAFSKVGTPIQNLIDSVEELVSTIREANGLEPINIEANDNASSTVKAVNEEVSGLDGKVATSTLDANDQASDKTKKAAAEARMFGDMRPNVKLKATDNASSVAKTAKSNINAIPKSVSVKISGDTSLLSGAVARAKALLAELQNKLLRKVADGQAATGTTNWKGGTVLLGDELSPDGAPRPELVITKSGKPFIAGMTGPVVTDLPAGSRVYTYSDTQKILSGGDISFLTGFAKANTSISNAWNNRKNGASGGSQTSASTPAQSGGSSGSSGGSRSSSGGSSGGSGSSSRASSSSGSSSGQSGEDARLEALKKELELLQAQYSYLESSDAKTEDLTQKSKEIQGKLHEINTRLRETGGEEKEIVENSTEWWNELKKIRDLQKEIYENERDLLETQATLMENQGKSASDRITKLRQIQDNLHREANYLRSIKASQADINQLSIEWWEIQSRILEIQQNLVDELDAAINRKLLDARKSRDAELAILDRQIKRLQEERDIQEEQLSIEERRKAVEEARFALENAQMERTVRYYNATTGQWEWGADQNAVSAAKKALEDAKKDRDKAERDEAYNLAIEELEAQRDEVNARYDALEARWERVTDALSDPLRDIKDILFDLLATGRLTDSQVALIRSLVGDIEAYTKDIVSFLSFRQYMNENPNGNVNQYLSDFTNGKSDTSSFYDSFIDYINKNPDASWTYTAPDGMQYHSDGTITFSDDPGQEGIRFDSSTDAVKASAEAIKNSVTQSDGYTSPSKNTSTTGAAAAAKAAAEAAKAKASDSSASRKTLSGSISSSKASSSSNKKTSSSSKASSSSNKKTSTAKKKTYDSGGILSGLGGIKATLEDEIVVPPDVAAYMLKPTAPQVFKDRMSELGFLYGATTSTPDTVTSGLGARTSNDHYGDVYQYGNITLTEEQARGMTVYELAQMSRGLAAYKYS